MSSDSDSEQNLTFIESLSGAVNRNTTRLAVFISMKAVNCVWIDDYLNGWTWNGRVELHTSIIIETSSHARQITAMI